jgi:clan AA aspartic protease (TIGR02281 family)
LKTGYSFELENNKLIVRISIPNKLGEFTEIRTILDTGAGRTVISENIAIFLGLDKEPALNYQNLNTASGSIKAKIVRLPKMILFERSFENIEVAIIKLPNSSLVSGLIGIDILYKLKEITINFIERKVYI